MTDSVLHEVSSPNTRWSTVNMAEVLPGVLTPLAWTFWRDPCEAGLRAAFADAGVLARGDVAPPASVDRRLTGLFHGRYAGNLDVVCELCDRTPGSSGASFEEQMFGYADPAVQRRRSYRRYPVVAVKMPVNVARLRRRLAGVRAQTDAWWRATTTAPTAPAPVRLAQAREHLRIAMRSHMLASLVAQGAYDQVASLAAAAGRPGLELELMTGYGGMEELRVSADLWEVSRSRLTLDAFLARHGYHGPMEGELSSRSWREDARAVAALGDLYRSMDEAQSPAARERDRAAVRGRAERALRAALPRHRRPAAGLVLRAAATFLPLREVGKAAFLQSIDGGRAAARDLGSELARAGALDDPEDVFLLTLDEATGAALPPGAADLIAARRAQRVHYLAHELPERWTGNPEAIPNAGREDVAPVVEGVPVSPGVVEGRARVVTDPSAAGDFAPGDVLVCETTDPSWVVLFQLAAAVVIDVGGPLSHGAIVARELGLPGVINTRTGTRAIADGDRVRVDGSSGRVEILSSPGHSAHAA